MDEDDARTFKVGFTAAGEKQFRELVREKLRGFRRGLDDTLLVRFSSVALRLVSLWY
jgi:hypothetical protein